MIEENIYKPPEADLTLPQDDSITNEFFPTSRKKLAIMYMTTFGLYTIYWFYKNWQIQEGRLHQRIYPVFRALFHIFYTHSLFSKIEKAAKAKEVPMKWSPKLVATIFVILIIISTFLDIGSDATDEVNIADYISLMLLPVMLFPIYYIQGIVNEVNGDPQGELNNSYSIYNYIFIFLGLCLWLLILISFILPY